MSETSEELSHIWQRQALDAPRISLDFLRHRTEDLRRRTQQRNAFEYFATVAGAAFITWRAWEWAGSRPLMQIAIGLWMVTACLTMFFWHRLAKADVPSTTAGLLDALSFHRQQLVRQRDARRKFWRLAWITAVPGLAVLFASLLGEFSPTPWKPIVFLALWLVFGFWAGRRHYRTDAQRIQCEIDALDSLRG
jgi:hypothetical protein